MTLKKLQIIENIREEEKTAKRNKKKNYDANEKLKS